ncbi:vWA domain-containing protein [Thioclava sp. FR2]|uniref:vWA domain-containing protein n=1 Tax=Thioclava sp. FR2 TaxID=3445780 RepID=UPI003EBB64AE
MTDEFDALKAGLKAAPAPRAAAREEALARAMAEFDKLEPLAQGSASALRPKSDRPARAGLVERLTDMIAGLKLRPILTASTSVAALGLVTLAVLPNLDLRALRGPAEVSRVLDEAQKEEAVATLAEEAVPAPAPEPAARKVATPNSGVMADAAMEPEALVVAAPEMAMMPEPGQVLAEPSTEAYANQAANPVKITAEEPVSTFSVDVDTASYAIVRNWLNSGTLPDPEAVRVEEMVNYFPYAYPAPDGAEAPFRPLVSVLPTPWNEGTQLVRIALQGRLPAVVDRPPLNLVWLIDTSGSMEDPAKLPLLKQSLGLMLADLRPEDQVAIVAYAGSAGEVLPPTPASDRAAILAAMDQLSAGGATAGGEGLELAYKLAQKMAAEGEVSRVLLATDGDFNVGISDPDGLEAYIARQRDSGVYLSVLGFGRGNLDDATMQALAQNGNGTASYIDTLQEARKVLVDQLSGALFPIADDVKIQVEWNPALVAEYRLIGYETRALMREDFNNDRVDAGEIGAGHQVTALYEITAPGSPALRNDPLRYGAGAAADSVAPASEGEELGFLRLRYKAPGEDQSQLIETPVLAGAEADEDARFAAAIAGFGQILRGSVYLGDWGWDQAIALAESGRGADPYGYRIEAINLMRLARDLAR